MADEHADPKIGRDTSVYESRPVVASVMISKATQTSDVTQSKGANAGPSGFDTSTKAAVVTCIFVVVFAVSMHQHRKYMEAKEDEDLKARLDAIRQDEHDCRNHLEEEKRLWEQLKVDLHEQLEVAKRQQSQLGEELKTSERERQHTVVIKELIEEKERSCVHEKQQTQKQIEMIQGMLELRENRLTECQRHTGVLEGRIADLNREISQIKASNEEKKPSGFLRVSTKRKDCDCS